MVRTSSGAAIEQIKEWPRVRIQSFGETASGHGFVRRRLIYASASAARSAVRWRTGRAVSRPRQPTHDRLRLVLKITHDLRGRLYVTDQRAELPSIEHGGFQITVEAKRGIGVRSIFQQ